MPASVSGSIITVSGAGTMAELAALSQITTATSGNYTAYDLGNYQLSITGTLTINPETECLFTDWTNKAVIVQSGGKLTINGKITVGGVTTYSENYWLVGNSFTNSSGGMYDNIYTVLFISNGGELLWEGGYIKSKQPIRFDYSSDTNRSKIKIIAGGWNALQTFNTYPCMVRAGTNDIYVDGFKFINGGTWVTFKPTIQPVFNVDTFNHSFGIGATSGGCDSNVFHVLPNYSTTNTQGDQFAWADKWQRVLNAENGSNTLYVGYSATSGATGNRGVCEWVKDFRLNINDGTSPLPGARAYIIDYDDGLRTDLAPNYYTPTLDYAFTAGADGITESRGVLLASIVRLEGDQGTNDTGLNKRSYRSKYASNSDIFDVGFANYGYITKVESVVLKGTNTLTYATKLELDNNITEPLYSNVVAYTSIDTLDNLYDALAAWTYDNLHERAPAIGKSLLSVSGVTINLPVDWSLVVDKTAADVVAVDTALKVITIKADELSAGTKFSGVICSGTGETLALNGSSITVSLYDKNGDSVLEFDSIDSWELYASSEGRDSDTNKIAEGTGFYRFTFTGSSTFYLRVVTDGTTIFVDQNVPSAGLTTVSLSQVALLQIISESIGNMSTVVNSANAYAAIAASQRYTT